MKKYLTVDEFMCDVERWQDEFKALRQIVLKSVLNEEIKWGQPCYTFNGNNILMIGGFKDYCIISFFKGALLKDEHHILVKAGENTQATRIVKFTSVQQIEELKEILIEYVNEAIEIEKSGAKVEYKNSADYSVPPELLDKFTESPELKIAFEKLTPGRQKAYLLHFSSAKQSATRTQRIEKLIPQILQGKGLND